MNFHNTEIEEWELRQYIRNMKLVFKTEKRYRCPRKEALQDYRHRHGTGHWFSKERKWVRVWTRRRYRRMLEREIWNEVYDRAHPHDYKTYGWLTW